MIPAVSRPRGQQIKQMRGEVFPTRWDSLTKVLEEAATGGRIDLLGGWGEGVGQPLQLRIMQPADRGIFHQRARRVSVWAC